MKMILCCIGALEKSKHPHEKYPGISDLPIIVIGRILSYIPWYDKMNIKNSCPEATSYLHIPWIWSRVVFNDMRVFTDKRQKEHRKEFAKCLLFFGKYIKTLELRFSCNIKKTCWPILCAIGENCSNLRKLKVTVSTNFSETWKRPVVRRMGDILDKCEKLENVRLINPIINWDNDFRDNMLAEIYTRELSHKIAELSIPNCSLIKHRGPLSVNFAASLVNLKKLLIKREALNSDVVKIMVGNGLQQLTIFIDREIEQECEIQPAMWSEVRKICPSFKVDLIIENILVRKELFPEQMPVRSVEFGKCECLLPFDINYLTTNYADTLESFGYTNFFRGKGGNQSVPFALYEMVKKSPALRRVRYGFSIPSSVILLIAKIRRLDVFDVSNDDIIYNENISAIADILGITTPKEKQWLQRTSQSKQTLSVAMTKLMGYKWQPLNYLIFDASQLLAH